MIRWITVLVLVLCYADLTMAQTGKAARVVLIKPKEDRNRDFEMGYKRHLEWHKQNKDTWAWYGWQIVAGENFGYFMDGTFGHKWEDFDNPVMPAADAADNNVNVTPYANFVSNSYVVLLDHLSNCRLLETKQPSAMIEFHRFEIKPGFENDFEEILSICHKTFDKQSRRHTVYKMINGGSVPQYLIMFPMDKVSELQRAEISIENTVLNSLSASASVLMQQKMQTGVVFHAASILRYRADMSYFPE